MSPELRFVAQLNRLARALELAADEGRSFPQHTYRGWNQLDATARDVRVRARSILRGVAEKVLRNSGS